jgi:hypothetical protein
MSVQNRGNTPSMNGRIAAARTIQIGCTPEIDDLLRLHDSTDVEVGGSLSPMPASGSGATWRVTDGRRSLIGGGGNVDCDEGRDGSRTVAASVLLASVVAGSDW